MSTALSLISPMPTSSSNASVTSVYTFQDDHAVFFLMSTSEDAVSQFEEHRKVRIFPWTNGVSYELL